MMPVTDRFEDGKFFIRRAGRRLATPLFVVLVVIETTDLVFAIDSIPAVLAITSDPFVVYTSNVFAMLGLRALYFAVAGIIPVFHHLHFGFAAILAFAGLKMVLTDLYKIPVEIALGVIGGILCVTMLASVVRPRREQITALMEQGEQAGTFDEAEGDLVEKVLELGDRRIGRLMRPRNEIVWLDLDDPREEIRRKITVSGHSRFPVATGDLDQIVGVVHVKDLLVQALGGREVDVLAALPAPLVVPEYTPALRVLELFKQHRAHLALIVDEHGVIQGLVTLHDMLEAIAGDLPPVGQVDRTQPEARVREDGSWVVDGALPIDEWRAIVGLGDLSSEERGLYYTVGGFVMAQLGRIPRVGDRFEWEGFRLEVTSMDRHRVGKILVNPLESSF